MGRAGGGRVMRWAVRDRFGLRVDEDGASSLVPVAIDGEGKKK